MTVNRQFWILLWPFGVKSQNLNWIASIRFNVFVATIKQRMTFRFTSSYFYLVENHSDKTILQVILSEWMSNILVCSTAMIVAFQVFVRFSSCLLFLLNVSIRCSYLNCFYQFVIPLILYISVIFSISLQFYCFCLWELCLHNCQFSLLPVQHITSGSTFTRRFKRQYYMGHGSYAELPAPLGSHLRHPGGRQGPRWELGCGRQCGQRKWGDPTSRIG